MGNLKHNLEEKVKGLVLENVDIIFISDKYLFERLSKINFPGVKKTIQLVHAPDFKSFKALSIRDMKKLGWIPIDKVKGRLTNEDLAQIFEERGFTVDIEEKDKSDEGRDQAEAQQEVGGPSQPQGKLDGAKEGGQREFLGANQGSGQEDQGDRPDNPV